MCRPSTSICSSPATCAAASASPRSATSSGQLSLDDARRRLIDALADAGAEKLNFAGGEPTLRPDLAELVRHAKARGFVTSIVTNGAKLEALLDACDGALDWVALSVDSAVEATQRLLGRGKGRHVEQALRLAGRCHARGVRLKLNTVVTRLNHDEDMSTFVRAARPERWKVFQVLRVVGENDGRVEPLLISAEEFHAVVARHAPLAAEGLQPVAEDNDAMTDSYAMIDPLGRFYGNTAGIHRVSPPILEVGVAAGLSAVGYDPAKFSARGGRWSWEGRGDE
ncbi:MAG: viperin family antiviral radical SAM protein [Myxococcota bacterium]